MHSVSQKLSLGKQTDRLLPVWASRTGWQENPRGQPVEGQAGAQRPVAESQRPPEPHSESLPQDMQ